MQRIDEIISYTAGGFLKPGPVVLMLFPNLLRVPVLRFGFNKKYQKDTIYLQKITVLMQ